MDRDLLFNLMIHVDEGTLTNLILSTKVAHQISQQDYFYQRRLEEQFRTHKKTAETWREEYQNRMRPIRYLKDWLKEPDVRDCLECMAKMLKRRVDIDRVPIGEELILTHRGDTNVKSVALYDQGEIKLIN